MATTFTANKKLGQPATADRGWDGPLNTNASLLDTDALGGLCVTLHEVPSTTLNVAVSAGSFRNAAGQIVTYAGSASTAMTTASTNYIYLTDSGTLTVNTTGFPAGNIVRLATVVAGATTITSITDARLPFASAGQSGQIILPMTAITATPYTDTPANPVINSNVALPSVINLLQGSTLPLGTVRRFKDVSGAAGTNNIVITAFAGDTIDGAGTLAINANYGKAAIRLDSATKWYTF